MQWRSRSNPRYHVLRLISAPDSDLGDGRCQPFQGRITHLKSTRDAIVNPRVIFEVLSKSTESYDRGKKFDLYRQLNSLKEYILVAQDEPHVERFVRHDDGSWNLTVYKGLDAVLEFHSLPTELPLSEIYDGVKFGAEDHGVIDAAVTATRIIQ